ncbi:MAG: acylphosphatase [Anaerolineaceae bacterium]|nr:acylphosphatase [Anaerolineaceae bacterium]
MNNPIQPTEQARLHAIVEGYVQGVGYRFFVVDTASLLELTGWVRNTYDGRVEVVAEGGRTVLEDLLKRLQRGPRMARVSQVSTEWKTFSGEFKRFMVLPTL